MTPESYSYIDEITKYSDKPFKNLSYNYAILGYLTNTPSNYDTQTDAVLDAKFNWRDEHTSKHNTDALVSKYSSNYTSNIYAFNFSRNITVNGIGCDIPNMQTLVRIFCDRATIHSLDSSDTTRGYWDKWFSSGGSNMVWSSSRYSYSQHWCTRGDGTVERRDGDAAFSDLWLVPVLDL